MDDLEATNLRQLINTANLDISYEILRQILLELREIKSLTKYGSYGQVGDVEATHHFAELAAKGVIGPVEDKYAKKPENYELRMWEKDVQIDDLKRINENRKNVINNKQAQIEELERRLDATQRVIDNDEKSTQKAKELDEKYTQDEKLGLISSVVDNMSGTLVKVVGGNPDIHKPKQHSDKTKKKLSRIAKNRKRGKWGKFVSEMKKK